MAEWGAILTEKEKILRLIGNIEEKRASLIRRSHMMENEDFQYKYDMLNQELDEMKEKINHIEAREKSFSRSDDMIDRIKDMFVNCHSDIQIQAKDTPLCTLGWGFGYSCRMMVNEKFGEDVKNNPEFVEYIAKAVFEKINSSVESQTAEWEKENLLSNFLSMRTGFILGLRGEMTFIEIDPLLNHNDISVGLDEILKEDGSNWTFAEKETFSTNQISLYST